MSRFGTIFNIPCLYLFNVNILIFAIVKISNRDIERGGILTVKGEELILTPLLIFKQQKKS
jgi:hypothetical protein